MSSSYRKQNTVRVLFIMKLVLLGFIVFSPISSFIMIDLLHFPISLPEILFVLFIPFCKKHFCFTTLFRKQTFVLILVWLFLIAIALLVDEYSLYSILSTARTYLYLIIFYLLFNKQNNVNIEEVYYICIGAFCGWILNAYITFITHTSNEFVAGVTYGPMLCIPIIIGIQVLKGKYKSLIIIILLSILLMIFAAMRRQMIVTVASLFIMLLYVAKRNKANFIKILMGLTFVSIIIMSNFYIIGEKIKSYSDNLYYRVVTKSELFIKGETEEGDDTRRGGINNFFNNIESYIFPRGFVSKQTGTDRHTGAYFDLPILELAYTFGVLGVFSLILFFGFSAYRCYLLSKYNISYETVYIFTLTYFVMFILMFLEGSFITFPYAVPYTGYCLGNLHRYAGICIRKNI